VPDTDIEFGVAFSAGRLLVKTIGNDAQQNANYVKGLLQAPERTRHDVRSLARWGVL
jgi:hypothetical protein